MAEAAAVLQAQINAAVVAALAAQAAAIVPAECMSSLFSLLFPFLEEGRISHLLRQLASQNLPLVIPSMG